MAHHDAMGNSMASTMPTAASMRRAVSSLNAIDETVSFVLGVVFDSRPKKLEVKLVRAMFSPSANVILIPRGRPELAYALDVDEFFDTDLTYALPGLPAPTAAADVQLGVTAYEGDLGIEGDRVTVNGIDAGDPANFFSSGVVVGDAPRDPSFPNQYGFDAHLQTVAKAFRPGDAGLTVRVASGADTVYLGTVTMVVAM